MIDIQIGDCRALLAAMEPQSVHCCVTSPPYFGLRDYGHGEQIGLEATPDEFVSAMVAVFREVRRVLRDDGTLWLNLGDSYASSGKIGGAGDNIGSDGYARNNREGRGRSPSAGLAPKQLIGIPWRVAFALQADGWFLRQDIVWSKTNPMPESVKDRCTKSHEYIFMLSKSPRYYYDSDAIRVPETMKPQRRLTPRESNPDTKFHGQPVHRRPQGGVGGGLKNKRSVWTVSTKPYSGAHFATFPPKLIEPCILAGSREGDLVLDPFNGSGTTGAVALQHHRNYVGIELNADYIELTHKRLAQVQPTLLEVKNVE